MMYILSRRLLVMPVQLLYTPLFPGARLHLSFVVWVGLTGHWLQGWP